jgi:glycine/D-amino acid oxidase-like deaminating enzyme
MGLMTAYHAAPQAETVTVLEKSRVGDPAAASFGLTRSARNDYRDPEYARLAFEARRLWLEFQKDSGERLLIDCGCLNLAKRSVTPELSSTYAVQRCWPGWPCSKAPGTTYAASHLPGSLAAVGLTS